VNGIEYRSTSTVSLSLESMYHAEGRVFNTNTGTTGADALRYEYTIKDHLGNARLSFTDKNNNVSRPDERSGVDVTNNTTNVPKMEYHPTRYSRKTTITPDSASGRGPSA
jgi:hypothetical protein